MCLFKTFWKLWFRYGQVPRQKSLLEHNFPYPIKLVIFATVNLNMAFVSIKNVVIRNDMVISAILVWLCVQRIIEDGPYPRPPPFRDKGTCDRPTEGAYIQPMGDLVY